MSLFSQQPLNELRWEYLREFDSRSYYFCESVSRFNVVAFSDADDHEDDEVGDCVIYPGRFIKFDGEELLLPTMQDVLRHKRAYWIDGSWPEALWLASYANLLIDTIDAKFSVNCVRDESSHNETARQAVARYKAANGLEV